MVPNPKPKVLQSLGQNSKIIWSLGRESQIVLLHNSISSLVKGGVAPKKLLPKYLHIFNFQYFCGALGTLGHISTTMREKEKSPKHAFRCNNNVSTVWQMKLCEIQLASILKA
jgi:hypothetical protein